MVLRSSLAVIASVSGNDIYRICFRIFVLNCCPWSTLVRWRPVLANWIVNQLERFPSGEDDIH